MAGRAEKRSAFRHHKDERAASVVVPRWICRACSVAEGAALFRPTAVRRYRGRTERLHFSCHVLVLLRHSICSTDH